MAAAVVEVEEVVEEHSTVGEVELSCLTGGIPEWPSSLKQVQNANIRNKSSCKHDLAGMDMLCKTMRETTSTSRSRVMENR